MTDPDALAAHDTSDTSPEVAMDGMGRDAPSAEAGSGQSCGTAPGCDGHGGCGGHGGGHGGGGCGHAPAYTPTLDARQIDPLIRQSAIFGVLVGLPPAGSVTVVTQENPAPIADLLHERLPGEYQVSTDTADDDSYRVTFARV